MPEDSSKSNKHFAHDLNNLLTRILNSVELLKKKSITSEDVDGLLNNIANSTYIASELIEDALGTSTKNNFLTRRININSIISDVVRTFVHQWKNQISFRLDLSPDLNLVLGKHTDYYRIFLNLITNSVEAIRESGEIKIVTENINNFVRIGITDNGKGITKEIIPHIFEDKYSTKANNDSHGVGLSIVKKIIDSYHGTITINSKLGNGTTISFVLPAAVHHIIENRQAEKSILVAEDEDTLRELLEELLISYHYNVLTVSNGNEVLEILKSKSFDLLLIDQKMPGMSGTDCVTEIRRGNILLPIILVTGSQLEDRDTNSISGINKIIKKPYSFEELLAVINEFVGS